MSKQNPERVDFFNSKILYFKAGLENIKEIFLFFVSPVMFNVWKNCKVYANVQREFNEADLSRKMKGVQAYGEKLSMVIASNLTSICSFYEEKIV